MNPFTLAKAVIEKRIAGPTEKSTDTGVPFQARIGSLVTLKASPFLRAFGSLAGTPSASQTVKSISKLHVPMSGNAHRLYTSRGDGADETEEFLQIYSDIHGEIQELVYFRRLARIYPQTDDEQLAYMGEDSQGLGQTTFSLSLEQMQGIDWVAPTLKDAFGEVGSLEFQRCAGDSSIEFVAPFSGTENRIDDSTGEHGLHQKIVFMPYRRLLAGGSEEQLLVETEIVTDRNGDASQREIHVDFMIGLVLSALDVVVQ